MEKAKTSEVIKLTKTVVDKAQPIEVNGKPRQKLYMDTELKGFGVCVGKQSKTYFAQRGIGSGRTVRVTIGRHGVFTVETARKEAQQILAKLARGVNPVEEKRAARAKGITLGEAWTLYQDTLKSKGSSPKTLQGYEQAMTYLSPWQAKPLAKINREDCRIRHKAIADEVRSGKRAGKYHRNRKRTEVTGHDTANRVMRVLRAVWNRARKQHPELPECPTVNVDFFKTEKPRTAIPADALPRWYEAVLVDRNTVRRDYLLTALLTGLRRNDVATMREADVDLDNAVLFVPVPKGGKAKAFSLPLSDYLVELLKRRKAENKKLFPKSPWMFPAFSVAGHIKEPRIDVPGLHWTPHDLRRTFITVAESLDVSSFAIKSLVNHSQPKEDVTGGYVSITVERLRDPMQKITDKLLVLCEEPKDNVMPFGKRKGRE
jgi:integrase